MRDSSDWLFEALAEEGVTHLFGNPGSTELPLVEAAGRQDAVRYVLGLQEAVVVGMADGWAQASGRMAAVNVHVQPGMANALSGVLNAARARVPMLVTVGQQVTSLRDRDPFLGGDVVGMARPLAKHAVEVDDVAHLPRVLHDAVRRARTPPCGPVVVSLPLDVQAAPAPGGPHRAEEPPPPAEVPPHSIRAAADLLRAARSPVVLAGDGVAHEHAARPLLAVAERLGAPVWGEPQAARAPVPWSHPLWRGQLPPFAADIRAALAGADVVLAAGMPVFRLFGTSPGEPLPPHCRLVHVDVDADGIGRSVTPDIGIVAGVGEVLSRLVTLLGPAPDDLAARRAAAVRATAEGRHARRRAVATAPEPPSGVSPAAFSRAVAGALRPGDLLVDESLTSGRALRTVLIRRPGNWLAHRGSALGWGLPAAVGAALADPSRRVMALQGDGSLVFGLPALWTAAHEGCRLALVVADNGGYEILRAGMEGMTGRPEGPWPGLAIEEPRLDLEALCAGFGASTARVGRAADLPDAMRDLWRRAEAGPAVLVVDVRGRTPAVGYPPGG